MTQFLNDPEDVQWLLDTHLKGVPCVPEFKSFLLTGSESSPTNIDLYKSADPLYFDDFYRVEFTEQPPVYCTIKFMAGKK